MKTQLILPENGIEERILLDPQIQEGLKYGKVRQSHPEGDVLTHVKTILYYIDQQEWEKWRVDLRKIALIHDSFKYQVEKENGIIVVPGHAELAADFYSNLFPTDERVREAIRYHDKAFEMYKLKTHSFDVVQFEQIFSTLDLDLLIRFNYADNCCREKDTTKWFEDTIRLLQLPNAPKKLIYPALKDVQINIDKLRYS